MIKLSVTFTKLPSNLILKHDYLCWNNCEPNWVGVPRFTYLVIIHSFSFWKFIEELHDRYCERGKSEDPRTTLIFFFLMGRKERERDYLAQVIWMEYHKKCSEMMNCYRLKISEKYCAFVIMLWGAEKVQWLAADESPYCAYSFLKNKNFLEQNHLFLVRDAIKPNLAKYSSIHR